MFSRAPNTSKLALVYLVRHLQHWNFELIDCQISSEHLISLGATQINRNEFLNRIQHLVAFKGRTGFWQLDRELIVAMDEVKSHAC